MGFDRNTVIGFILIGVLMIGMFYFNSKNRLAYEAEQAKIADSIKKTLPPVDTAAIRIDSIKADSIRTVQQTGAFNSSSQQGENVVLENELLKVTFSSKGAQPKEVVLKHYKKYDSSLVTLQTGNYNNLSYTINSGNNQTAQTSNLIFTPKPIVKGTDGSQTLSFVAQDSSGKSIEHSYTMHPENYMIDFVINLTGAQQLFTQPTMNLVWNTETPQIEKDFEYEKTQVEFPYLVGNKFDFERLGTKSNDVSHTKPTDWIGVKQQFFADMLIAKNKFNTVNTKWTVPQDSSHYLAQTTFNTQLQLPAGANVSVPFQIYYGPSDYKILKKYNQDLEQIVPYGSGIFSFVKYINRYFLLPVFDFFAKHIASMGLVILLMTFLIRLITSPILYKSYLSGAKMKVLKPEVDALKEKFKNPKTGELDQQAFGMEQMKLWRTAGVSPLGGCIPALLQIPIFMSLYYFFQSNIALRGKNFLWANDLSTYDSILQLPFNIPMYGNHVSLFTLLAVITSLLISLYGMSNMQDQSNPMMKYLPFIFPIFLLGIFNRLPSALTWYYTVSNVITLVLQFVIQKYIIDHDKILAKINENKKKPKQKSKLQERIEAMQEQQKKIQEMKKKS